MRHVLLVGSVGYDDRESVFRTLAQHIGACTPRFTDGEVPPRNRWMMWQRDVFARSHDFELDSSTDVVFGGEHRVFDRFRLAKGIGTRTPFIGSLGYAKEAVTSYQVFRRLREEGVVADGTRFQMSLPSAVAVCSQHIRRDDQLTVEQPYEAALRSEVLQMLESIPAEDLSIQWDICQEVLAIEGAWDVYYQADVDHTVKRLGRLASIVPEPSEVGFHFCYGDPGHKHIKEPADLGLCVALANGVSAESTRSITWVHMPVPRNRGDSVYMSPLSDLKLGAETELFLGLVHLTDGRAGTMERLNAAKKYRHDFGIATECGFGRRPPDTIPDLLKLHADIALAT